MAHELGKFIRKLRRDKHLRLRDVASYVGKSVAYISDIEAGKRALSRPNPELLIKFADFFDVPVTTMMEKGGFVVDEQNSQYKILLKTLRNKTRSTLIVEKLSNIKEIITELETASLGLPPIRGAVRSLMISMRELDLLLTKNS